MNFKAGFLAALLLFFLFTISGCGGVATRGHIAGTVVNVSYAPLSGATVTCSTVSGSTNFDGSYTLRNISQGSQTVAVTAPGFSTATRTVNVQAGRTTYIPLLVMTPVDSKLTEIGVGGGTAYNTDGSIKLVIPAGALSTLTSVSLTNVDIKGAPAPAPSGYQFLVIVYIAPATTTLSSAATLTVPDENSLTDGQLIPFYHYNTSTSSWESIGNGTVEASTSTISAKVSVFGWIAALLQITTGGINGKVVDASGLPISDANVWISGQSTVTDSNGNYSFSNVSPGNITVYFSKTGYSSSSNSVWVTAGSTTTVPNITLALAAVGTLQGKVINGNTMGGISGARVTVGNWETWTDSEGDYAFENIAVGNYTASAYANGFLWSAQSVSVSSGGITTINFVLDVSTSQTFSDDMESGVGGWTETGSGFWHLTTGSGVINSYHSTYVTLPSTSLPTAHSSSYYWWYGQDSDGSYIGAHNVGGDSANSGGTSQAGNSGGLSSPLVDMRNFAYGTLSFWTWWEIEGRNPSQNYDVLHVQISTEANATWTDIATLNPSAFAGSSDLQYPYSSGGYNAAGVWVNHSYDLSSYVGNRIQIRFFFETVDHQCNGFRGWIIDDVAITDSQLSPFSL